LFLILSAHTLNRLDEKRRRAYASLKSANLELHKVNQTLKSKIKEQVQTEAARQKTELELFQSQKMEAMGTLASGIAHDFNNMLTVIQLNAENALDIARKQTPESEEMLRSLKDIKQAGVRAADVVRKIMTFGRKTPGLKKPVHVEDAIKETLEMLRHSRPKDVILHTDIPSDLPAVFADPTQIQQVLINLGTNAVQAMSEHGGDLTIRVAPVTVTADQAIAWGGPNGNTMSTGPYVRISVIDTGHGMDGETLKKIFDPFFTTKPPGKGTGLGLSVAHGIMRIHGGAITVESAPGVGTCFHVFFPVLPKNTTTLEAPTDSGSEDPGH
jgi:two-component system cell cycle sensor histidine kinase/response regulator CckA